MTLKYTKEVLEIAVKKSNSLAGVLRALGKESYSGALSNWIRQRLILYEIDTSHFTGLRSALGKIDPKRKSAEEIFAITDRTPKPAQLRRALLEVGVLYQCSGCGCSDWLGQPLILEVDHIDGNRKNNQRINLRFLCPNCHSQTSTFGNRTRLDQ